MGFDRITGQDALKARMASEVMSKRGNTYIVSGPEGSGRKGPAGDQVILTSKGRLFACTCGATVFTKGGHGARTVYYCSGCGQGWSGTERLTEK